MSENYQAREAAADYFAGDMEQCPDCEQWVPFDELESLIGTKPICLGCRCRVKQERLEELLWPLGLA